MTKRECAIVMAYTGICMLKGDSLGEFYRYLEELAGCPVYTHELADVLEQPKVKRRAKEDFLGLCAEAEDSA